MKNLLLVLVLVGICTSVSLAGYTYTIDSYTSLPDLSGTKTMLITGNGGGGGIFELDDFSSVTIESTSNLGQGTGGIWHINLTDESHMDMSGGQIYLLTMNNNSSALLSGGVIEQIWNYQITWKYDDGGVAIPNPHITIDCLDWDHNTSTNLLTGHWNDNIAFSIQLHDVNGKPPAFNNIQFIPEPMTLALFGLGAALIRKRG